MAKGTKKQTGQPMQYRVVYEIDVVASSEVEAAVQAYQAMIDPESMAPCLEVIPWQTDSLPADNVHGTVIDLDEHYGGTDA